MTARRRVLQTTLAMLLIGVALGGGQRPARAGEEDDLQREIDTQRVSVADLERLDELKATGDEITQLRSWLDEAWGLRSKHEYDQVREVLERTRKQADLIRAKITASKLRAQANAREAALADVRARIARTQKALADTIKKKKAIEGNEKTGKASDNAPDKPGDKSPDKTSDKGADRPGEKTADKGSTP